MRELPAVRKAALKLLAPDLKLDGGKTIVCKM
jgi:hypothetical protein